MEYRTLGRSGLKVSEIVLGTMNFGNPTERPESLRIIGEALNGNGKRSKVFLVSKVFMRTGDGPNDAGNSKHHILEACESSLKRLRTDHIDLYLLHRTDLDVPQEETLNALDLLIKQGKVRHIGCSTHPPWKTVEALWIAEKHHLPKFTCEEPPYNLLDRRTENEIIPMCRAYDLGIISWSPLAQGVLTGRYTDEKNFPSDSRGAQKTVYAERITRKGIKAALKLSQRAQEKDCSTAQLALAWVLQQPGITGAIIGPRTVAHLEDLLPSADLTLDEEDLDFCNHLVPPGTHVSDHFNTAGWVK